MWMNISQSQINLYRDCPYAYAMRYKFKKEGIWFDPNIMEVGKRYQYKEDSHIYNFIFLGWEEDEEYYVWKIRFDEGDMKGVETEISSLKDMTGMYFSGMPSFMEEDRYMTKWNRKTWKPKFGNPENN